LVAGSRSKSAGSNPVARAIPYEWPSKVRFVFDSSALSAVLSSSILLRAPDSRFLSERAPRQRARHSIAIEFKREGKVGK